MDEFWDGLRASLTPTQRNRYDDLLARFTALGAPEPDQWALSEVTEGIPQLARFCLLRSMWTELIDYDSPEPWISHEIAASERDPRAPFADAGFALKRLLDLGADPMDIVRVARSVAYVAVFGTLHKIDEGFSPDAEDVCPGWVLMETDAQGNLTGRRLGGLHEDILSLDPSGREGRPEQPG